MRAVAILTFNKCLHLRGVDYTANNCKTAFILRGVESASDDYSFKLVMKL